MGKMGAWLSAIPNRFDGTELSREEFQDNLAIRYGLCPRGLPECCDGCNEPFLVEHGLSCKRGGFVGQRHDDVCEELAHLCLMALTTARISSEPEIFYGRRHRGRRTKCWATKSVGMLGRTAFGNEGGPLSLTFRSATLMPKATGITSRRKSWRARHVGRRRNMRKHVLSGVETSLP